MNRKERRAEQSTKVSNSFAQLFNQALALHQAGKLPEAEALYRQAMAVNPNISLLYNNFGVCLYAQGKNQEAVDTQKKAIALDPNLGMAHNNMGVALNAMSRHAEALEAFSKALAIEPNNYQAINNFGDSCVKTSRFDEGLAALHRALEIKPDYVEALTNLGAALWGLGRLDEAKVHLRRAIALQPDVAMAHKNLGIISLLQDNYAEGWAEYDWRWRADKIPLKPHTKPVWTGVDIRPGALLIWSEQGVGDEILHASMIADMAKLDRFSRIVWECDPRLVSLFKRSNPTVEFVPRTVPPQDAIFAPDIAGHIPSGSIGNFVRRDISQFPRHSGYLVPDPARKAAFRQRLAPAPGEKLIGMSWLSKNIAFGASKSTTLAQWAPILRTPNCKFVDLQYGDTAEERAALTRDFGITIEHIDGLDLKDDMEGLAALTAACDLVTTVSNTTAHMAGAVGVPVWTLIASGIGKFWYWGFDGPTTVWYPSASLIRQPADESWEGTLQIVAERLKTLVAS
ncbi:MAG: tetratricopeptide repeat protein [Rhodospirillaceae bacterium]